MTKVPLKRVCLAHLSSKYTSSLVFMSYCFITGMDSPVRRASFKIDIPDIQIKSHGRLAPQGTLMKSPGSNSALQTILNEPSFCRSSTSHTYFAILITLLFDEMPSLSDMETEITDNTARQIANHVQLFANQNPIENNWNR